MVGVMVARSAGIKQGPLKYSSEILRPHNAPTNKLRVSALPRPDPAAFRRFLHMRPVPREAGGRPRPGDCASSVHSLLHPDYLRSAIPLSLQTGCAGEGILEGSIVGAEGGPAPPRNSGSRPTLTPSSRHRNAGPRMPFRFRLLLGTEYSAVGAPVLARSASVHRTTDSFHLFCAFLPWGSQHSGNCFGARFAN
jgi:hypothetical protein